jgi:hypothetical protein
MAFALGTAGIAWWTVPLVAGAWGWVGSGTRLPALTAALAAAIAWGATLLWSAVQGPVPVLVTRLGEVAGVNGGWFVSATLLLPFVWAAAACGLVATVSRPAR